MFYEINVALNGSHFFATAQHSLTTAEKTQQVYQRLRKAFPKSKGFDITVTYRENTGRDMTATFDSMAKSKVSD